MNNKHRSWLTPVARTGLATKGIVYCLVGLIAFMAAFRLGGQSTQDASTTGALQFAEDLPAGRWILLAIGIGLLCYALWRVVEAFTQNKKEDEGWKKWRNKLRLVLSGLGYLSLGIAALRLVLNMSRSSGGNTNQKVASGILDQPLGQWLLGLGAVLLAGIGVYQIYYALSEKYKKHISSLPYDRDVSSLLLKTGKLGFVARGVVWMILGWMMLQAALSKSASEAGDTSHAFSFLQNGTYGSLLLGAIGAGFFCYGIFSFVRARHERFD